MLRRSLALVACALVSVANVDANACIDISDTVSLESAITACERIVLDMTPQSVERERVQAYLRLAQLNLQKRDYPSVDRTLAGVKQSAAFEADKDVAFQYFRYQSLKYWYKKELTTAEDYAVSALKLAEDLESAKVAKVLNELAVIKNAAGKHREALTLLEKSLKIKQQNDDLFGQAVTLSNLGLTQIRLAAYRDAEVYYQQALDRYAEYLAIRPEDTQALHGLTHLYEDLVLLYSESKQLHKSDEYVQRLVANFERLLSAEEQLRVLATLLLSHVESKRLAPAQGLVTRIEALILQTSTSSHLAPMLALAQFAFVRGELNRASTYAEQALKLSESNSSLDGRVKSAALLAKIISTQNQSPDIGSSWERYIHWREQQLKQQYDSDLSAVNARILREQLEWQLEKNRLESERQNLLLDRLRLVLLASMLTFVLLVLVLLWSLLRKRQQRLALMKEIEQHRHQLWLLQQTADSNELSTESVTDEHTHGVAEQAISPGFDENQLRVFLVEAMIDCVRLWEQSTTTNRIELADRSKIWRVSIDDGRLRTRSLDKYLSIDKLPQQPRWRGVVQTCHYVLAECELAPSERRILNEHLSRITSTLKLKALQVDASILSDTTLAHDEGGQSDKLLH